MTVGDVKIETVIENFMNDKKVYSHKIPLILLQEIGKPVVNDRVPRSVVYRALLEIKSSF